MALSIQKKFRWEISEIVTAQWNSTFEFRLHRPGTQATARLVIVLVSRIQKSGAGVNNFVKWKGRFRSDWPEMNRHGKKGLPWKLVPNIPVGPSRNGLFHLIGTKWNSRSFGLNAKRANTTDNFWGNKECAESAKPANQAGSPHMIKPGPRKGRESFV